MPHKVNPASRFFSCGLQQRMVFTYLKHCKNKNKTKQEIREYATETYHKESLKYLLSDHLRKTSLPTSF